MNFYKNSVIARKFNISNSTVTEWIRASREGKNALLLVDVEGKFRILKNRHNDLELLKLKQEGLKYRPKSAFIKVDPDPRIYEIFSQDQLTSLFVNISYYNFIPLKFSYTNVGAKYYELAFQESLENENSATFKEISLIDSTWRYILDRFKDSSSVNIVELGMANSNHSVKNLIQGFNSTNQLDKYISLSTSADVLKYRAANLKEWFNIKTRDHLIDLEEMVIRNILFKEKTSIETRNLCLALESLITNIRNIPSILRNLAESLNYNDYLLFGTVLCTTQGMDLVDNRQSSNHDNRHNWLFEMLGISQYITTHFYQYDMNKRMRLSYFIPKQDILVDFKIGDKIYPLYLNRDKKVNFFFSKRFFLNEFIDHLQAAGLAIEQFSCTEDESYGLFLTRLQKDNPIFDWH